jgi:hypothetical protein
MYAHDAKPAYTNKPPNENATMPRRCRAKPARTNKPQAKVQQFLIGAQNLHPQWHNTDPQNDEVVWHCGFDL